MHVFLHYIKVVCQDVLRQGILLNGTEFFHNLENYPYSFHSILQIFHSNPYKIS